ncbi:MAG: glycosyltransferase [Gemmatimonadaceae bacterium]
MNYLFVHSAHEWSGTARAFTAAARGLARRGHSVVFAAEPNSTVERVASEMAAGGTRSTMVVELLSLDRTWLAAAQRLRGIARRQRADVVFVHTDREHFVASVAYRIGSHARVIRRVAAGSGLHMRRTGSVAAWLAPTCYMFATERDVHAAPIPRGATGRVVAPLGVEEPPPRQAVEGVGEHSDIVCVHDASSRSRAAAAIRAVAMLAPRHPTLRLLIVGEGAYDDDLRMQAAALRALPLISFLGERADQTELMRDAVLGWVVADGDTAAYAILDFMSLGIPVLIGDSSVAEQYMLSEITGVILPRDEAFVTAATVADLLSNNIRRETMGAAAWARVVREFPESAMVDGFERAAATATSRRRR